MKNLDLNQMESVEGGLSWKCGLSIAALVVTSATTVATAGAAVYGMVGGAALVVANC